MFQSLLPARSPSSERRSQASGTLLRLAFSTVVLGCAWWLFQADFITDFGQDYAAARAWWDGRNPNGSTIELLKRDVPELAARYAEQNPDLRTPHPPVATLLALPFGRFSWPMAQRTWLIVCWVMVTAAWEILRLPPVVCFATAPLWIFALTLGTHEPLLFVLLASALAVRDRSPVLFGSLIGLCTAVKLYPAVFLFGCMVSKQYRALLAGVTACVLALLLSEAVLGWGVIWNWWPYLGVNTLNYVDDERNVSLVRLVRLLIPGAPPTTVGILLAGVLVIPIVRILKTSEGVRPLLPVVFLVSPLSWRHYLGLLSLGPLRWPELVGLFVPPLLLLLGSQGVIPSKGLSPLVDRLLVLLVQMPLLLSLLGVWYRWVRRSSRLKNEPRTTNDEGDGDVSRNPSSPE